MEEYFAKGQIMNKKAFVFLCVIAAALLLTQCSTGPLAAVKPDSTSLAHIQQVILSLPQDSSIRRTLEAGEFGQGVHQQWMDDMKTAGLREAVFEVHGIWHSGNTFHPQAVSRVIYRTNYDGPNAQIIDAGRIAQIRASGLERKLQDAAFHKAEYSRWPFESRFPSLLGVKCFVDVYLFDDEWITDHWRHTSVPIMGSFDPSEAPLYSAAQVGDFSVISDLLKNHKFSKSDLDRALFGAITYPSDNTDVIHSLIVAGADPNAARDDGTTVLMESVDFSNSANIKALIALGADKNRKNRAGDTALSLMQRRIAGTSGMVPTYVKEAATLLETGG